MNYLYRIRKLHYCQVRILSSEQRVPMHRKGTRGDISFEFISTEFLCMTSSALEQSSRPMKAVSEEIEESAVCFPHWQFSKPHLKTLVLKSHWSDTTVYALLCDRAFSMASWLCRWAHNALFQVAIGRLRPGKIQCLYDLKWETNLLSPPSRAAFENSLLISFRHP